MRKDIRGGDCNSEIPESFRVKPSAKVFFPLQLSVPPLSTFRQNAATGPDASADDPKSNGTARSCSVAGTLVFALSARKLFRKGVSSTVGGPSASLSRAV